MRLQQTKMRPFLHVLLDYFITRPPFKNLNIFFFTKGCPEISTFYKRGERVCETVENLMFDASLNMLTVCV